MKVILLQDVKGKGKKGQRVEVSDGYARNYLIPRNLAIQETADNVNVFKQQEKARLAKIEKEKKEAMETAEKLKSCVVKIPARAGSAGKLFGAVTSKEIADSISEQCGIVIEKNKIIQAEPIKAFGTYEVKCKLGHEITGVINVIVTEMK
ncbi:MAG: 50S ribosomal protein L9 [Clostridiales bacterium]|jgi:large subunit ribosomal protein L9|nr:50S ribosomal protein L9 [Clostridiales bacterium]